MVDCQRSQLNSYLVSVNGLFIIIGSCEIAILLCY